MIAKFNKVNKCHNIPNHHNGLKSGLLEEEIYVKIAIISWLNIHVPNANLKHAHFNALENIKLSNHALVSVNLLSMY